MFFDGLKVFIVQLVYFIIPFTNMFIGIWISISSLMATTSNRGIIDLNIVLSLSGGLIFLGLTLTVVFGAFFTITLSNMAYCDGELVAAPGLGIYWVSLLKLAGWTL